MANMLLVMCIMFSLVHVSSVGNHTFAFYDGLGPYKVQQTKAGDAVVWYPLDAPNPLPVYQFICGTGQAPIDYRATVNHIASHGFFVISNVMDLDLINLPDSTKALKKVIDGSAAPEGVTLDANNVAIGGHSGGGPEALKLSGRFNTNVKAYVGQHAAAIPDVNKPSKKVLDANKGVVLQICGTKDVMPFCGCGPATNDYFNVYPKTTKKMLLQAPDGHIDGTEGKSGNKFEGGWIVAFLYHVLKNDPDARLALHTKKKGYNVTDVL